MTSHTPNPQSIRELVLQLLARELRIKEDEINADMPLVEMGLDSMSALIISGELEDRWGVKLPTTLLWDCPTVEALVKQLMSWVVYPTPASIQSQ
jgi:acyl carrier protein